MKSAGASAAATTAAATKGKAAGAAAAAATAEAQGTASAGSTLALLQFGDSLFKAFSQQPAEAAAKLPLTRYADYLHHFGFSVERESRGRGAATMSSGLGMTRTADTATSRSRAAAARPAAFTTAAGHLASHGSVDLSALADTADWGISAEMRQEADARSEAVGLVAGVTDCEALAKLLSSPFTAVTWRQTATQCAVKRTRCLYAWLCAHMTLQLRPLDETTPEAETGATAAAAKSQRSAPGSKKANRPAKREKEASPAQEAVGPLDPHAQAMAARRVTPLLLAQLYARMLGAVGVRCDVVTGQLKGMAPGETFEWAWNVVRIEGRSYLVDAAAALSDGVLRSANPPPAPSSAAVPAAEGGRSAPSSAAANAAGTSRSGGAVEEADATGAPRLLPTTPAAMRRDFFFFTHPSPFLSTHLPHTAGHSLVALPTKAVHWVMQPCVTPALYHYDLQLVSHPTHAAITTGSTPAYLSLANSAPGTTELCCVLFSGTLQTLAEDVTRNVPLGPEWVWHQREDTTDTETFTLTVPQAGYYVAVVGARTIREEPYSAVIAAGGAVAFTPVVFYEVRVGFTSSSVPVLPRQYLSPSICRLMQPLCAQVTLGSQRFTVMPSCSNVRAVAVVRRTGPSSTAAATAAGNATSSTNSPTSNRALVSFLPFNMKRAAFEGYAEVKAGDVMELWVLYGAPDHNGQQLSQRVVAVKASPADAPAAVEAKAADKKKKKPAAAEQPPVDEVQMTRLEHALHRGEVFQLFVGGIEAKSFISPAVVAVIQPQPTVEQEQAATLRRLAGVTDALMSEAGHTAQYQVTPVGSYFGAVATATVTR